MPERTSPQRIKAAHRQAEALKLRASGMRYEDIAKQLGYKNHQGAWKAVKTALKKTIQEPADELRQMEAERLDRMLEAMWAKATSSTAKDATWYVDRVLKIMERRAALLGLDATGGDDVGSNLGSFLAGIETQKSMAPPDMSEQAQAARDGS